MHTLKRITKLIREESKKNSVEFRMRSIVWNEATGLFLPLAIRDEKKLALVEASAL